MEIAREFGIRLGSLGMWDIGFCLRSNTTHSFLVKFESHSKHHIIIIIISNRYGMQVLDYDKKNASYDAQDPKHIIGRVATRSQTLEFHCQNLSHSCLLRRHLGSFVATCWP